MNFKTEFDTVGYVIVDDAIDPAMVQPLLAAARRVRKKFETDPERYSECATLDEQGEFSCLSALLSPNINEPIFADYLISAPVLKYAREYLGDEVRLGSVSIFTHKRSGYHLLWHRDIGNNNRRGTPEEEFKIFNVPTTNLRWHTALVDNDSLHLVPRSHSRLRTDIESRALIDNEDIDLPGETAITLRAGQTVYWNGWLIHRGIQAADKERFTLVGGLCLYDPEEPQVPTNILEEWMLAPEVRAYLPESMKEMYDRWLDTQIPGTFYEIPR